MAEGARDGAKNASQADWGEHVHTYDEFIHLMVAGIFAVIITLVCLAMGGIGGAWWTAGAGIVATLGLTLAALNNPNITWKPFTLLLLILLFVFALVRG